MTRFVLLLTAVLGLLVATPAAAQNGAPDPARSAVDAVLRGGRAELSMFAATIREQVPTAEIDALIAHLVAELGPYRGVTGTSGDYTARFANGTDEVLAQVDGSGRLTSIFFKPPIPAAVPSGEALAKVAALRGTVSYVVVENGTEHEARDAGRSLAVGSTFKLAILAALQDEIAAGRHRWDEVIPLDGLRKSLPSGVLQSWPDGTPITVATYANEMVSISDNTAADALARLVGQRALARYAGTNVPFLSTREMFVLKSTEGTALRARYLRDESPAAREALLADADRLALPAVATLDATPMLDLEWHYAVRDLCRLMARDAGLALMTINPGAGHADAFARIAYKGGSDVGVISMTTQVVTKRGTTICLSATENDAAGPVDDTAFETAYAAALASLAGR